MYTISHQNQLAPRPYGTPQDSLAPPGRDVPRTATNGNINSNGAANGNRSIDLNPSSLGATPMDQSSKISNSGQNQDLTGGISSDFGPDAHFYKQTNLPADAALLNLYVMRIESLCLEGYTSVLYLWYFISSGALGSLIFFYHTP